MPDILLKIFNSVFAFLKSINPIIWALAAIFYLGNRILKRFETDRDIKLIEAELENENPDRLLGSASAYSSNFNYMDLKDKYVSKKKVANIKIGYLKKVKKYCWFFYKKFE